MHDTVTGTVWVHYGYLQLGGPDSLGEPVNAGDGVVISGPNYFHILVGKHTGTIHLTISTHRSLPTDLAPGARVDTAHVAFDESQIAVETFGAVLPEFSLDLPEGGPLYVVRVSTSPTTDDSDAEHHVTVDIWPKEPQ